MSVRLSSQSLVLPASCSQKRSYRWNTNLDFSTVLTHTLPEMSGVCETEDIVIQHLACDSKARKTLCKSWQTWKYERTWAITTNWQRLDHRHFRFPHLKTPQSSLSAFLGDLLRNKMVHSTSHCLKPQNPPPSHCSVSQGASFPDPGQTHAHKCTKQKGDSASLVTVAKETGRVFTNC